MHVTHLGTATALIELDNLTILTDPYFSPAGTEWPRPVAGKLINSFQPPLEIKDLPPIDLILLSHEDHKDNLDDLGRELLNGRRVITTIDGARKLSPRPGVIGLKPWETTKVQVGNGPTYTITATPCVHLPPGEVIGFIVTADHFGTSANKPKSFYFSGDTVYIPDLAKIKENFHVSVALFNLGKATITKPDGSKLQTTMDSEQAVHLQKDVQSDVVIPMHFEGWNHFIEGKEAIQKTFQDAGVADQFKWLEPGSRTKIL